MNDESFFSIVTELIARQNPKVADLLDKGNRIKNSREQGIRESKRNQEGEKKQRHLDYYHRFCELFKKTPIESRKELIDLNKGKITKNIIENKIKENYSNIKEDEDLLLILDEFYGLIHLLQFDAGKKGSLGTSEEEDRIVFNLKATISFDAINRMKTALIEANVIDKNTSLNQLKSVFIPRMKVKKVDWTSKSALKYFVNHLVSKKELFEEVPKNKWKVVEACFLYNKQVIDASSFRKTRNLNNKELISKLEEAIGLLNT